MTCTLDTLYDAARAAGWDCYRHPATDGLTPVHVYGPVSVARYPGGAWTARIWPGPEIGGCDLRHALRSAYDRIDSRRVRAHVRPVLQAAGALPVSRDLIGDIEYLRAWAHYPHAGRAREEALGLIDRIRWAFEDLG